MAKNNLRPFWSGYFSWDWKLGAALVLLVCIPRFVLVLRANQTGNYASIGLIMLVSALVPFLFLSRQGRQKIGIRAAQKKQSLILALFLGIASSLVLYWIGAGLYGNSDQNWYQYIGRSYNISAGMGPQEKFIMFLVVAITGMLFSPVGEELFFRGIVNGSFTVSFGEKRASVLDSAAFALTHIAHFGLVFVDDGWQFFWLPALLWIVAMFLVSQLFFRMKKEAGSLLGAIVCHAGFNLGMIYSIFYGLAA